VLVQEYGDFNNYVVRLEDFISFRYHISSIRTHQLI